LWYTSSDVPTVRKRVIDPYFERSVGNEILDNFAKLSGYTYCYQFVDQSVVPHPVEGFFDIEEHRCCSFFVICTYAEVVDEVGQLEGGGMLFPEGQLFVPYFVADRSLNF
jgi:hypothetical protein